ncbi:MAG: rhodanese-like domain-containing protein [Acidobacteria bacterium]|nr:rhodanese-like domain-containing protein [Acidobacteriota bacterium]MCA1608806.1 rhodanese-like domain-containing protein [Acidobacteriota bacterium]
MRKQFLTAAFVLLAAITINSQTRTSRIPNPAIDMKSYLSVSAKAAKYRASRRLTEDEFIKMAAEDGTVVLDARSRQRFDELHVKGAVNLSFPDITIESLATHFPDKETRILIYCNNNFSGAPRAFPTKMAPASLNISTYISLYTYGYRNVYELGPLIDIKKSKLIFQSSAATVEQASLPDREN